MEQILNEQINMSQWQFNLPQFAECHVSIWQLWHLSQCFLPPKYYDIGNNSLYAAIMKQTSRMKISLINSYVF